MSWEYGGLFMDMCILGSDVSILGTFASLLLQLSSVRSAESLSLQTLLAIVTSRGIHLCSHVVGIHFAPRVFSMTLFQTMDVVNVAMGLGVVALFLRHWRTYEAEKDNFGLQLFERFNLIPKTGIFANRALLSALFIYSASAVLTIIWSTLRGQSGSRGISYTTASYEAICTLALIPQLWMFHKDKWVSQTLGWFVAFFAAGRMCTFTFWLCLPLVLDSWRVPPNRTIQLVCEVGNLLVLSDFMFYWARSKLRGEQRIRLGSFDAPV